MKKHKFHLILGLCLFFLGLGHFSLDLNYKVSAIFTYVWFGVVVLFIVSNWRQIRKQRVSTQLQLERERRLAWVRGEREFRRKRVGQA